MRIAIVLTVLLAGCATGKAINLPDGRRGYKISCDGTALSWGNCYEKAGEICQSNGYDIISKNGDQGATMAGNQYGVYAGTIISRTLLIACK